MQYNVMSYNEAPGGEAQRPERRSWLEAARGEA